MQSGHGARLTVNSSKNTTKKVQQNQTYSLFASTAPVLPTMPLDHQPFHQNDCWVKCRWEPLHSGVEGQRGAVSSLLSNSPPPDYYHFQPCPTVTHGTSLESVSRCVWSTPEPCNHTLMWKTGGVWPSQRTIPHSFLLIGPLKCVVNTEQRGTVMSYVEGTCWFTVSPVTWRYF